MDFYLQLLLSKAQRADSTQYPNKGVQEQKNLCTELRKNDINGFSGCWIQQISNFSTQGIQNPNISNSGDSQSIFALANEHTRLFAMEIYP